MKEKTAIVTGASRGIGKEIAKYLAQSGYSVALLARSEEKLREVFAEIQDKGGKAMPYVVDVSSCLQVQSCINQIINKFGHIDLLINNAAILMRGTSDMASEHIDEMLKINLNGAIYVASQVASHMKKQLDGYIINISSLGGKNAMSFSGVYAASKFGLCGFSEALTKEMSYYCVKVTSICPSMIATDMAKGRKFPLHDMIQVDDMIKTISYLLSLSKNAIPHEITIGCLPLIERASRLMHELYLN